MIIPYKFTSLEQSCEHKTKLLINAAIEILRALEIISNQLNESTKHNTPLETDQKRPCGLAQASVAAQLYRQKGEAMIKAVCADCGHVWWAAVIMGENRCPKCNSENTYIAFSDCNHKNA